jgi:hypothetical protein
LESEAEKCPECFLFLGTQDSRYDEVTAGADGGSDLRGGEAQDFAEDIGHNERIDPAWSPAQEICFGHLDAAAAVAEHIGPRGFDGPFVIVESIDLIGTEFLRSDS